MAKSPKQKVEGSVKPVNHQHRIDILDSFRAIAILVVVWLHVWEQTWLSNNIHIFGFEIQFDRVARAGFLGVELFFFISGFCLFYPFAKHLIEQGIKPSWKQFYYRRFIKIVPSYLISIVLMVLMEPLKGTPTEKFHTVLAHLTFSHNFVGNQFNQINGLLWSLSVEVQFYLLFPLVCWLMMKKPFLTGLSFLTFGVVFRQLILGQDENTLIFLCRQLPTVIDIFVGGMLAGYVVVLIRNRLKQSRQLKYLFTLFFFVCFVLFWAIFANYLDVCYTMPRESWKLDNTLTYFNLACIGMITSGCFASGSWLLPLNNRIFIWISSISYNLYIWHQWIILKLKSYWQHPTQPEIELVYAENHHKLTFTAVSVVTAIAVAAIITYLIERPLLRHGILGLYEKMTKKQARFRSGI